MKFIQCVLNNSFSFSISHLFADNLIFQASDIATAVQFHGHIVPIEQLPQDVEARAITDEDRALDAYTKLRKIRSDYRLRGVREKRAKDKAEEEANKVCFLFFSWQGVWIACLKQACFFSSKFTTFLFLRPPAPPPSPPLLHSFCCFISQLIEEVNLFK